MASPFASIDGVTRVPRWSAEQLWSNAEDEIIRRLYPLGGSAAVVAALAEGGHTVRLAKTIVTRAVFLGVRIAGRRCRNDGRVPPEQDSLLSILHGFSIAIDDSAKELARCARRIDETLESLRAQLGNDEEAA